MHNIIGCFRENHQKNNGRERLPNPDEKTKRTIPQFRRLVTLHEVLHLFDFIDKGKPSYDDDADGKIMDGPTWIRSGDMSEYTNLGAKQIQKIQQKNYPR